MPEHTAGRYNRTRDKRRWTIQAKMRRTDFTQLVVPVAAIALISVMYYATQHQLVWMHNILQHLYFAPIAAAAIYYGWKGGMGAAILAALCYAPHVLMGLNEGTEPRRYIGSEATEILDFFLVGLIAGILADRERRQKDSLTRTTKQLNAVYQELQQNFERMMLAAAGEGAILADQREPHRECSMAVSGDSLAWCGEQAFRPSGGDFQGIGVYRSDGCFGERGGKRRRAPVIVSMSPPGYPSAMVASLQCLLPFRLARLL